MSVLDIIGYVLLGIACLLGAVLLLLIILIITTSVTAKIRYDGEAEIKIKYLFFTIVRSPESPSQIRKKKRKKKKEEKRRLKELKKREKLRRKNRRAAHLKTNKKTPPRKADSNGNITFSADKSTAQRNEENIRKDKAQAKSIENTKGKKAKADKKAKVDFQTALRIFNSAKPHIKKLFKKIRLTDVLVDIMVGGDDAAKTAISYGVHCSAIYGLIEFLKQSVTFKAERITIKADFDLPKTDYYASATLKLRISTLLGCLLWGFLAVTKELNKDNPQEDKQHKVKNQPLKKAG